MAAIIVGLSIAKPAFLSFANGINVGRQISINGILAVGGTYVLLTGGVDLSLGSLVALTGVVAACFAHPGQYPVIVPVLLGYLGRRGLRRCQRPDRHQGPRRRFIVTLGSMTAARGLALLVSGGKPVSILSRQFTSMDNADLAGIPVPIVVLLAAA